MKYRILDLEIYETIACLKSESDREEEAENCVEKFPWGA
jgi:hypothetical protein